MKKLSLLLFVSLCAAGCEEEELGPPTGTQCPDNSTLTYDTFGSTFMDAYCTGCHAANASDRHGAPDDVNLDSLAGIHDEMDEIDRAAGAGPEATNDFMPDKDAPEDIPGFEFPSMSDRAQLAEWIACGAP